jgi:small subunit ribosomal protein S1
MFSEPMEEHKDEEIIQLDEGWWDSILAEEEKFLTSTSSLGPIKNQSVPVEKNNWEYLEGIYKNDAILKLMVTGFNRGGLLIQGEGVQGFVPVSHLVEAPCNMSEEDRKKFLSMYHEKELSVKIIEFVPDEERIVFSERAATAGEGKRKLIFENIHPGDIVTGVVTNITDFGVFLDLGGLEGLIHVSELSWGRVEFPGDILCVGQRIEALVLNVTEQNSRIALSYKRLVKNPWDSIESVYSVGDVVSVKITSITKFGAFARLKEGVEGLIHVSTIELPAGITDFTTLIHKDDCVSVKILHIDSDKKRIGLCLQGD